MCTYARLGETPKPWRLQQRAKWRSHTMLLPSFLWLLTARHLPHIPYNHHPFKTQTHQKNKFKKNYTMTQQTHFSIDKVLWLKEIFRYWEADQFPWLCAMVYHHHIGGKRILTNMQHARSHLDKTYGHWKYASNCFLCFGVFILVFFDSTWLFLRELVLYDFSIGCVAYDITNLCWFFLFFLFVAIDCESLCEWVSIC